jgi:hypothetical protein
MNTKQYGNAEENTVLRESRKAPHAGYLNIDRS